MLVKFRAVGAGDLFGGGEQERLAVEAAALMVFATASVASTSILRKNSTATCPPSPANGSTLIALSSPASSPRPDH